MRLNEVFVRNQTERANNFVSTKNILYIHYTLYSETKYCLPMNTTEVIKTDAQWSRSAYMNLIGEKVVFDCSDGEYGPIEFDLDSLEKAIEKHKQKLNNHTWLSRIRKYTQAGNGN